MSDWLLLAPEIHMFLTAAVFFAYAMRGKANPARDYFSALVLSALGILVSLIAVRVEGTLFSGVYRIDLFSQTFKVLLSSGLFLVVGLCSDLSGIRDRRHPEFYLLLAVCTFAMMMLASGVELLTIYLALELSSYSLYVLVPLRKGPGPQMEAGFKFFLIGAVASATTLLGMALVYGVSRTTQVTELIRILPGLVENPAAYLGLLLMLSGFFFKLALFPFHIWAPNVYQGAANQVSAFIATATKVAAIAILLRVAALGSASERLTYYLISLSIASMTFGNLAAIVQKDLKRLLAYSAVAHAGYVLIGVLSMTERGFAGSIFYALAYLAMNFVCFMVVVKAAEDGEDLQISRLAGLHRRSPILALSLLVGVFSLGGIPPTIGFTGKFFVFTAAMQEGHFAVVLIGMINVVVSLYYYAHVVRAAFLLEPEERLPGISLSLPFKLLAMTITAFIVIGGLYPRHFYELAVTAAPLLFR